MYPMIHVKAGIFINLLTLDVIAARQEKASVWKRLLEDVNSAFQGT